MAFDKGRQAREAVERREREAALTVDEIASTLMEEAPTPEDETPAMAAAPVDPVTAALIRIQEQNAENTRRQLEIAEQQLAFQRQTLDEDRRVRPRENANHPEKSAFSYPEGNRVHPKPTLRRATYWPPGVRQTEDLLTPEEIEAFNGFTHNCTARDGTWTATITRSGTTEILVVDAPVKTPDDRMNLPNGLLLILRELRDGPEAVDVVSMATRIARLEAQLAGSAA